MTIQEAIRSGKRVKRLSPLFSNVFGYIKNVGISHTISFSFQYGEDRNNSMPLSMEDIIAEDWEVEEEKITITKDDLYRAMSSEYFFGLVDPVAKKLGFKS